MPTFPSIRRPEAVQAAFDAQHRNDALGHRIHLVCGMIWCFLVAAPTSVVELAVIPIYVFGLWRIRNTWRTWLAALLSPPFLLLTSWMLWTLVTVLWSPDWRAGLGELNRLRFAHIIWLLWPVIDRRGTLLAALIAGFLVGNLAQAGHVAGHFLEIPWLDWPRFADRYSAWWDPVVGGTLLCGALGVNVGGALLGTGRARTLAACAGAVTLLGILATGTRGAWIAAGGVLLLAVAFAALRIGRPRTGRAGFIPIVALIVVTAIATAAIGPSIYRRASTAWQEVSHAAQTGDYSTFTGARLFMYRGAVRAVAAHPLGGVGSGGFRNWMEQQAAQEPQGRRPQVHAHAHSTPLHIAATTGLIGLALAGSFFFVCLRGAFSRRTKGMLDPAAAAAGLGLVGLLLAGLFDTIHVNAQTAAMLYTLVAFTITPRPSPPAGPPQAPQA